MLFFIEILKVIFPIFFMISLGYLGTKYKLISKQFSHEGNKLIFNVTLPLFMFFSIYSGNSIRLLNFNIFIFILIFTLFVFVIGFISLNKMNKPNDVRATLLQAFLRPNLLVFGAALAKSYYQDQDISTILMTLGLLSPISNMFSILAFEIYAERKDLKRINIVKILLSLLSSNIILAAIIGFIVKGLNIHIPYIIEWPLQSLGNITTPLGLIFIGSTLNLGLNKEMRADVIIAILGRNFIVPTVGMFTAIVLGFTGQDLFTIMIAISAPVAIASYVMADIYVGQGNLASNIIMSTTLISSVVMFIELYVFTLLGLL